MDYLRKALSVHNGWVPKTFTKRYRRGSPGSARLEALSLAWLAQAPGGARVAKVLGASETHLELEYLPPSPATAGSAEAFGRALARTHAAGAAHFGAPPPGWSARGWIGAAPMSHLSRGGATWGEFYAAERVMPYAAAAAKRGALSAEGLEAIRRVAQRLRDGLYDSPQPALLPAGAAARLHGDLWAGNVLWTDSPASGDCGCAGVALIDPAAHGGHAETDLAMLALFGLSHLDTVTAAYNEVSPLAAGWRERTGLHQLFPLLVHAVLFGGSYGAAAAAKAKRYG
ncbi:MAG: fructosamine kinase family protein [Bifidobacteriaceae bacterium]|nr:fructosamine kinase family protein [Bifidobacteriaceae bacterium]